MKSDIDVIAQEEALELADLTTIYKALDVLGAVPWRINARVLDVVEEVWVAVVGVMIQL